MPIGYQNQSTVWYLGGDNISFNGHGTGTLDGNGQVWYDYVNGISNYPSAFCCNQKAKLRFGRAANGLDHLEHTQLSFPGPAVYSKPDVVCFSAQRNTAHNRLGL